MGKNFQFLRKARNKPLTLAKHEPTRVHRKGVAMNKLSPRMIEELKEAGHYFAAGVVAKALGGARFYGCHTGMRSTRDYAIAEFNRGYDAN